MEELIEQYRKGAISREELEAAIEKWWNTLQPNDPVLQHYARPQMLEAILKQGKQKASVRKLTWWKYAAAAVFIAAMVFTGKLLINKNALPMQAVAKADVKAPVINRAMVTLANGKTVYLDSAANGQLASVENMQLLKLADGKILYKGSTQEVQYNTLTNPKGSRVIDITLSDGSRIWLNAGSSLTYPTAFNGDKRQLTLKGEGYFKVAHDDKIPFIASAKGTDVKVYGTEFNIKAYDDDADMKVTLLKGSVGVTHNVLHQMLKPGEQAVVTDKIKVDTNVDTEEVMAWLNGHFSFTNTSVEEIMKQAARWYDVDVVMETKNTQGFTILNANRDVPISKLLHSMETSGGVHFEIEGKKVIVRP